MLEEKIRKEKEELALILERERELENMKYKVNVLSENFKLKMEKTKNKSSIQRHAPKKKHQKRFSALEENRQKVESCRAMAGQLADPTRDYRKFDSRRRAQVSSDSHDDDDYDDNDDDDDDDDDDTQELFVALDEDNSGGISEAEYVNGCKTDDAFVKILTDLSPEFIWGYTDEK